MRIQENSSMESAVVARILLQTIKKKSKNPKNPKAISNPYPDLKLIPKFCSNTNPDQSQNVNPAGLHIISWGVRANW
jgi:hypothetical protein